MVNNQDTESVIVKFLERLGSQDADGVQALFAPEVDWFVPGDGRLPWPGRRSAPHQIGDYFRTMWPHYVPGASRVDLEKIIVDGMEAVVLAHFWHVIALSGRPFDTPAALHLTVAYGQITRLHLYEDTLAVERAFFG